MLLGGRAIQGIGGGGLLSLVNICISDLFSLRTRGIYFSIIGGVWASKISPVICCQEATANSGSLVASAVGPILGNTPHFSIPDSDGCTAATTICLLNEVY